MDIHPSCKLRKNHAEAQVVVAIAGAIAVAVRYAAVRSVVVPAAAAVDAVRAFSIATLFIYSILIKFITKTVIFQKKFS